MNDKLQIPPIRTPMVDNGDTSAKAWYYFLRQAGDQTNLNTDKLDLLVTSGEHADRPDPTLAPEGALFTETDRDVIYQLHDGVWQYVAGVMRAPASDRPTDLGANDAGFRFDTSDTKEQFYWSGSAWVDITPLFDPTLAKGDLIVRGDDDVDRFPVGTDGYVLMADSARPLGVVWGQLSASQVGAVPSTRRVNAGTGMTGGGTLAADVTLNANVISVFGRTGTVALTQADITGAGGVPTTRQVLAGAGMTGGGALSADVTLTANVTSVFGRTGAVVLTNTEKSAAQTPWLQNIDGAGFALTSAGNIGSGTATIPITGATAGRAYVTVKGASDMGVVELATGGADGDLSIVGQIVATDPLNSQTDKRNAAINFYRSGSTANNRGGMIIFATRADAGSGTSARVAIDNQGRLGIGTTTQKSKLGVVGLLTYASNAAALSGGLQVGDFYTDGAGAVKVVF